MLYQLPGHKGELLLFYKTGIYIKDWVGHLMRGKEFGPRTPLTLALSRDGLHWQDVLTLEEGVGEFSYPSIIESNSTLHIVYTWNRKKIKYVKVEVL